MEWNEDTIVRLRALWDEGHSTAEIGRRLGVTKNAVVGKAHRLELPARPSPIRRDAGRTVPRKPAPRRTVGPTLTPMTAPPPRAEQPVAPVPRSIEAHPVPATPPAPVLRAVPAAQRLSGRVSACCWPIGEPGTPSFHFCGDAAAPGRPYCADHVSIAYVKVRDRREDAA